jgi:hypothetical protein
MKVKSLLSDVQSMEEATADVYGERGVKIRYRVRDLMWRPVGQLVRFVAVVHPTKGKILLMTTDLTLCPLDVIRIYGLRFKIEHMFRQAVRLIGSLSYHFWMMEMTPLRYRMETSIFIASRSATANKSVIKFTLTTSSSSFASSPMALYNISRLSFRIWRGAHSGCGLKLFAQAFLYRNL